MVPYHWSHISARVVRKVLNIVTSSLANYVILFKSIGCNKKISDLNYSSVVVNCCYKLTNESRT
jgi:hypothetical protein